jgi:hypothetical protein
MPVINAAEPIIRAFQQGLAERQQQQQFAQDREDRKLEQDVLKHRLAEMKIQSALQMRVAQVQAAQMQSGQPRESYGPEAFDLPPAYGPTPDAAYPGAPGTPLMPHEPGLTQDQIPEPRLKPIVVAGNPEYGWPDMRVPQQTKQQGLAEAMAQRNVDARMAAEADRMKTRVLNQGDTVWSDGKVIGRGDPKPEPQVQVRTVDAQGRPVTRFVPQSEAAGQSFPAQPRAASGAAASGALDPAVDGPIDPVSRNILSQTGLGINAFKYLVGQASQLPRDQATRNKAAKEAQTWSREHNVDVSTLASQYKTYNDVLSANIARLNNTQIMEGELIGTVQNLQDVVKAKDFGKLKVANVIKLWAGQEVNDDLAQQYAMHLSQLRNELTAYFGATQGRSGNNLTIEDKREAEGVIRNGIAQGSLDGLLKAVENSTGKMATIMQGSVDRSQKAIWGLFGVGQNYQAKPKTGETPPPAGQATAEGEPAPRKLSPGASFKVGDFAVKVKK